MIHISYCFDKNYQQHFGASLMSLLLNFEGDVSDLCVHVITDEMDHVFSEKLDRLRSIFKAHIEVSLLKPDDLQKLENLPAKMEHMTFMAFATWYRILIASILPPDVQRVLHLDSDTIVLSDIRDIFNVDMKGAPIAGVADYSSEYMSAKLHLNNYINAGVLLMDLQQW